MKILVWTIIIILCLCFWLGVIFFLPVVCRAESGWQGEFAADVKTDTVPFVGHLSDADDTVQKALETLDSLTIPSGFTLYADSPLSGAGTSADHLKFTNPGYLSAESDPIVKAINGIVKSNGTTIGAATADSDYAKAVIRSRTYILDTPTATDVFPFEQFPYAITLTKVTATVLGGTSIAFNLEERASNALGSAGTDTMTSDLTATATGANTTSFSNAGVAAYAFLVFTGSSLNGAVGQVVITIEYTV
jgi:hypothetical protein